MISRRARITKRLLHRAGNKVGYDKGHIAQYRQRFARNMSIFFPSLKRAAMSEIAGVRVARFAAPHPTERTILYIHGGGFVFGSPQTHRQHTARLAKLCHANVLSVDYALAPENPFPIALGQLQSVWQELWQTASTRPKQQ